MKGRKPKPTHLRLLGGNAGKRPINEREPTPVRKLPSAPRELNKDAKREWRRVSDELYRIGLLTDIDRGTLAAYCQAYGRWVQAERILADWATREPQTGALLINTKNGNAIQNPIVGIANKAMADMVKYAVEFGLTPSARSRIQAAPPKEEADPARKYFA